MEKTEIIKIIDQLEDYRFKLMRRNNIKWHLEKDLVDGFMAIARDRKRLLEEAQNDLEAVEPSAKEMIQIINQQYAMCPRDKALRLISLYIEMINMEPLKLEKHRQKINTLRQKVLGKIDEVEQIRQQNLLFD